MSHSKFHKRGNSLYIENWNPEAQKYIHTCCLCSRKGYSPAIEEADFLIGPERKAIRSELMKMFPSALDLDSYGHCDECAKLFR